MVSAKTTPTKKAAPRGKGESGLDARIVLVTVRTLSEGRRMARTVVKKRLAACVNILLSPVNSIYRWKEKVEVAHEYCLIIKTTGQCYPELEKEIVKLHSYDVPEIVALPISAGLPAYLTWLRASVN
ncbi:MAG TPA: divalent-cation tolerance protein CutA [Candidatus Dormibacteraeota bacterium]|nr:divalent-cation tolerance protein CutA [Candidatus Dormibacteraeota bacterium]